MPRGWTCCARRAAERAKSWWWPWTTWTQSLAIVDLAREHFPHLQLVARARDVTHWNGLRERGVTRVTRELFESSKDRARLIAVVKQGREQLEAQMAQERLDREAAAAPAERGGDGKTA
jgi:glutathione-regulated potassium-efflux system ancillary protein KefC